MPACESLLLLLDDVDLADALAFAPEALAGHVVAFDVNAHLALTERAVAHVTPWQIIGYDERPGLCAYEAAILDFWRRRAVLPYRGLNLLAMAEYRHHAALARLAWAAYAVRRFVEALRPRRVYAFDEPPAHGLDQPAGYRRMPLLSGLLRGAAEQRGISVTIIPRASAGFVDQVALLHSAAPDRPSETLADLPANAPFVLFQANGGDLLRQLPLVRAVRSQLGCAALQVYKDASPAILARLAGEGHPAAHETALTHQFTRDSSRDSSRDAGAGRGRAPRDWEPSTSPGGAGARYAEFRAVAAALPRDLRLIFDNPHVRSHFDFLFGEYARRVAAQVDGWRGLFARRRPAAFVGNYHSPLFDIAAAEGIPCVGLTHGLMMIGQPRWFASLPRAALIGALSEYHRDRLIAAGIEPPRVRVTGDPWADEIRGQVAAVAPAERAALRARLGIAPQRRIVLLCTGSFGMPARNTTLPLMDWARGVRDIAALGELAARRADLAFVIKPHPRFDYPALYERVNANLSPDRRLIVTDAPLIPLATLADCVCMWNTLTSALAEAALCDKPALIFGGCLVWCDLAEHGLGGWPQADTLPEFERQLDALLGDGPQRAACLRAIARRRGRFVPDGDSATARCANVLAGLIARAGAGPGVRPAAV